MKYFSLPARPLAFLVLALLVAGCTASKKSGAEQEGASAAERVQEDASPGFVEMNLEPVSDEVRTTQFYFGDDERQLPILPLDAPDDVYLTLEFDLMSRAGRPLSVYFYHADRTWRRDLSPVEYLDSFQRDDLLEYTPSLATSMPYTHYTYRFPNQSIDFRISGNYIVRVTEQGQEDAVLFERAFFVTEQDASAFEMGLESVLVGGQAYPSVSPIVRFMPPSSIQGNLYDYNVCFVRNGRFEAARCTDRPSLMVQPALQFYLEPEMAFEPQAAEYFLDLSALRVGGQIEATDLSTIPFEVTLEPDYARFPGTPLAPLLNGQAVVEDIVRDVANPDIGAEYVQVGFSYVPPDERPLQGDLIVTGSFNGWQLDPANRLTWMPERGRYEGSVLIKQGQYEYRYVSPDRRLRQALAGAPPSSENHYTAFVYYSDLRLNTDRLLAVGGTVTR